MVTAIWTDTAELSPVHEMRDKVKGREGKGQRKAWEKQLVSTEMSQERDQPLRNSRLGV